jgi:hypothetical protein
LRRAFPVLLILIGLAVTFLFGMRAVRSFRQVQYIQQQGLDRGTASVEAIQPWMTVRFIAVAYAVPEEYLYSALEIPFDRRNADKPLGSITPAPPESRDGTPPTPVPDFGSVLVARAKEGVLAYRADPIATGLREIRPWMSLRYISNSKGIPLDELFAQTGLAPSLNPDKPLELLAEEADFPGGLRGLTESVARALGIETGRGRP